MNIHYPKYDLKNLQLRQQMKYNIDFEIIQYSPISLQDKQLH